MQYLNIQQNSFKKIFSRSRTQVKQWHSWHDFLNDESYCISDLWKQHQGCEVRLLNFTNTLWWIGLVSALQNHCVLHIAWEMWKTVHESQIIMLLDLGNIFVLLPYLWIPLWWLGWGKMKDEKPFRHGWEHMSFYLDYNIWQGIKHMDSNQF